MHIQFMDDRLSVSQNQHLHFAAHNLHVKYLCSHVKRQPLVWKANDQELSREKRTRTSLFVEGLINDIMSFSYDIRAYPR